MPPGPIGRGSQPVSDIALTTEGPDLLLSVDGRLIADYRVADASIADEYTPKPYFHPVRTLDGTIVSGFAPEDHPWHHGLQFGMPRVGDDNFWGGGTYFGPERGYVVVADHGAIRHREWLDVDSAQGVLRERCAWEGHGGEMLLDEVRTHRLSSVIAGEARGWRLDLTTELTNVTDADLALETPAQRGRPDGGYGGWFFRLAEGFTAAALTADGVPVDASGVAATVLVVDGRTADGTPVTIGLHHGPSTNPGDRAFLYRFDPFPLVGFSVAYDDGLIIESGATMSLSHRIAVFDGSVGVDAVADALA